MCVCTPRDDINAPAVEFVERDMMRLSPLSYQRTYKYQAMARGAVFLPPHNPLFALPTAPTLALTRRLTRARPAKRSASVVVTTTDSYYPDVIEYPPSLLLPELLYTTGKEGPSFPDLESPVTPTLPPERPPLQHSPSSNLVARWNRVDVRDSVLIAELEELRRSVELADGDLQSADDHRLVSESWCNSCTCGSSSEDNDLRWRKAQKSAFCRRELIKTELTYLEGILQLENKDVSWPTNQLQVDVLTLHSADRSHPLSSWLTFRL